ncbi:MAG: glycosyltransferase family 39 protein, partial [Rhizobiales bacterium]|nr:glycosyltransferase family 39 protein [Hyphomicrobiales bacterium]
MTHRIEMHAGARPVAESRVGLLVLLLAVITLARLLALRFSVTDLQVDEAQYWDWSQHLAFGYFSKPPLIGWTIAAANMVCGTGVACVRAPSPLFYFGTSLLIYATAVRLYDRRIAFWAS